VETEEVGEDCGGQVGGEGGERSVACGSDGDVVPVEQVGEAVPVDGLSGNPAGEQPSGCVRTVRNHERCRWSGGQALEESAEAWWQQDGVLADRQVDAVALLGELVGGEVSEVLSLEGEQEDERSGCPGFDGESMVGQAAVQQVPALLVVEELCGFLAWDGGDGKSAAETAVGGPAEEVADAVAALGTARLVGGVPVTTGIGSCGVGGPTAVSFARSSNWRTTTMQP
jgi:hypothetical protein